MLGNNIRTPNFFKTWQRRINKFHEQIFKKILVLTNLATILLDKATINSLEKFSRIDFFFSIPYFLKKQEAFRNIRINHKVISSIVEKGIEKGLIKKKDEFLELKGKSLNLHISSDLIDFKRTYTIFYNAYSDLILKSIIYNICSIPYNIPNNSFEKIYNSNFFFVGFLELIRATLSREKETKIYLENLPERLVLEMKKRFNITEDNSNADIVIINNLFWQDRHIDQKIRNKRFIIAHPSEDSWWGFFNNVGNIGEYVEIKSRGKYVGFNLFLVRI
ncbi:MAG: hypothetical protein ABGF52_12620 [Candidatus Asgardarchaeum sp.]